MTFAVALVPRAEPARTMQWASPLLAIVLTLLAGALLFALMGQDPLQGLKVFLWDPLATRRGWSELGLKATPLILCAVGLAVCFRANVWNIGAEGQLIAGAIAGGGIALLATRDSSGAFVARGPRRGRAGRRRVGGDHRVAARPLSTPTRSSSA